MHKQSTKEMILNQVGCLYPPIKHGDPLSPILQISSNLSYSSKHQALVFLSSFVSPQNQQAYQLKKMRNPGGLGGKKMTSCCSKVGIKKGPWTPEEDQILSRYIELEGEGAWRTLPKRAGLLRCGKSCRLRWMNYLRPHLNHAPISPDEEDLILRLHRLLGNRWSLIAGRIPGRTDNEIKNYWNTHLSKKLISQGLDPRTHKPLEIYNPNSNPIKLATTSTTSMAPSPPPLPLPVVLGQEQANESGDARAEESDGMMMMTTTTMEDYSEDMYFSSFLDSIMMGGDGRQFDDSNQHVLFQEMMTMQPMYTYEPNLQGLGWESQTQSDLDPAEMERKRDQFKLN